MDTDVSIIIVNYNTAALIKDAVSSIREYTSCTYEILIVDNASPDGSGAELQSFYSSCTDIKVLLSLENRGFGQANNYGYEYASGKYIFCLNPDTILKNDAIGILCNYLNDNPKVGISGGNLFDADDMPTLSYKRLFPSLSYELSSILNHIPEKLVWGKNYLFNYMDKPISVAYITGADLMIRKSVIDKIGFFSPDFFMYYEETDLCLRARKNGIAIMSVPEARIMHLEGKSTNNLERKAEMNFKGRETFYSRHYSKQYNVVCDFVYMLSIIIRLLIYKIRKAGNVRYWEHTLTLLRAKYK